MLSKYFQLNKFAKYDSPLLRHNILMHTIDGSIFLFAISFVSVSTVLPVFIQRIGGNAVAVGSVSVLWYLGLYMPQLLFIRFFHNKKKIKPAVLGTGLIFRFQFLILSVVCFLFLGNIDAKISVPLMLFLIFITTIAGSTTGPPWFHFFSKTTPVKLRGRLLALRWMFGSTLGLFGGYLVSVTLSSVAFPDNFALLFLLCFIFTMISFYFLNSVEESSTTPADSKQVSFKEILSQSRKILRRSKDFKNYLLADALILMSLTASSFYAVYAISKFDLPTSYAGTFTIILMAGQLLGNFVFGYLGDYFGHKINILILASASAVASLSAVLANNILVFGIVFFFTGCTLALQGVSRLPFVVEMCSESERPIYVGLLNTITAPAILFGILGGFLITIIGYVPVFLIYTLISLTAVYWLHKKVNEPRKLKMGDG